MNNWTIKIIDTGYEKARSIYIFRQLSSGETMFLDGKVLKGGEAPSEPTIKLEPEQLQALADELSMVGYKPQKGFIEGKLEATTKHLEDMRSLVFKSETKELK